MEASLQAPLYFAGGGEALYGVLTRPSDETTGTCFVSMHGGGYTIASHSNRITYQLAQEVAARGISHFRYTYRGVANSTGRMELVRFDEPYLPDIGGAADRLRQLGYDKLIVMGTCFGSRTALSYAGSTHDIAGLVLVAPSPRDMARNEASATKLAAELSTTDYLKRAAHVISIKDMFKPKRVAWYGRVVKAKVKSVIKRLREMLPGHQADPFDWVSPLFLGPLESLVGRGVLVLILYGDGDWFGQEFQKAKGGRVGRLLDGSKGLLEVQVMKGNVQGLTTVSTQELTTAIVLDWMSRHSLT